jgi:hypothetical protein
MLQSVKELASMDLKSDEARFLRTGLKRKSNKILHALTEATEMMKEIEQATEF